MFGLQGIVVKMYSRLLFSYGCKRFFNKRKQYIVEQTFCYMDINLYDYQNEDHFIATSSDIHCPPFRHWRGGGRGEKAGVRLSRDLLVVSGVHSFKWTISLESLSLKYNAFYAVFQIRKLISNTLPVLVMRFSLLL